ncbi:hypothetical protein [Paenibacillus sabinae]|uniref:hypothetical protein n=1 Tax=Paenibacillus sabinae TaxID=365617 RepID=UPI00130D95ED|nr:hypothetical protein [Paenibacillus sabinae]
MLCRWPGGGERQGLAAGGKATADAGPAARAEHQQGADAVQVLRQEGRPSAYAACGAA